MYSGNSYGQSGTYALPWNMPFSTGEGTSGLEDRLEGISIAEELGKVFDYLNEFYNMLATEYLYFAAKKEKKTWGRAKKNRSEKPRRMWPWQREVSPKAGKRTFLGIPLGRGTK